MCSKIKIGTSVGTEIGIEGTEPATKKTKMEIALIFINMYLITLIVCFAETRLDEHAMKH